MESSSQYDRTKRIRRQDWVQELPIQTHATPNAVERLHGSGRFEKVLPYLQITPRVERFRTDLDWQQQVGNHQIIYMHTQ